jgi:cytoskeletal protein RodZ
LKNTPQTRPPRAEQKRDLVRATASQIVRQAVLILVAIALWAGLLVVFLNLTGRDEVPVSEAPQPTEVVAAPQPTQAPKSTEQPPAATPTASPEATSDPTELPTEAPEATASPTVLPTGTEAPPDRHSDTSCSSRRQLLRGSPAHPHQPLPALSRR